MCGHVFLQNINNVCINVSFICNTIRKKTNNYLELSSLPPFSNYIINCLLIIISGSSHWSWRANRNSTF